MNFFKVLQFVPLINALITFIRQAEGIFNAPGSGVAKLQYVLEQLQPFLTVLKASGLVNSKLMTAITDILPNLITLIVQVSNLFGGVKPLPVE